MNELRPHQGPQEKFLASPADIVIYGGAAGGGKSYALLMEAARHRNVPGFNAVAFRRTFEQIRGAGGLWDVAGELYPQLGGTPNLMTWRFHRGAMVKFCHLQHEKDKFAHQGDQICLLIFDELTHFSESQFFYMLSRNRSLCGVTPYVRASCNPDSSSWVAELVDWWIDGETGLPIPERSGVIRWFARDNDALHWGDTENELVEKIVGCQPKSFTFVAAKLQDNPTLMQRDPGYMANLMMLPRIDRERLLHGNWKTSERSIVDREWIVSYVETEATLQVGAIAHEKQRMRRFATIDTAGTSREMAEERRGSNPSWSVCAIWDYEPKADLLFLRHVWRARVGWNDLKRSIASVLESWHVQESFLENAHVGPSLKEELAGRFRITLIGPTLPGMVESHRGAKLERAIASGLLVRLENGRLIVPAEDKPWKRFYVDELTGWDGMPTSTADQVDISSYAAYKCKTAVRTGAPFSVGGLNLSGGRR